MKTIKFVVNEFTTKEGVSFSKATIKGKFLPLALAEEETYYNVRFVGNVKIPTKKGIYEVSYNDNGLWIDSRKDFIEKHIVRINAVRCVFADSLKSKEQ